MSINSGRLAATVSAFAILVFSGTGPAYAQNAVADDAIAADEAEDIVVTGSLISRPTREFWRCGTLPANRPNGSTMIVFRTAPIAVRKCRAWV